MGKHANAEEKIWTRDFMLIWTSNFFIFLGFQMTLPTLPLFVEELGGNDQLIGMVVGIFTFSALLLRPYAGHALETKGRGFVYLSGLGIFAISVGSYGIATGLLFLFIMRIIQGIGWGLSTTASGTIATDLIPPKKRGEGMGYYGLSGNLALAIGPSLGLTLVGIISFKQLFFVCGALGAIALMLSSNIKFRKAEPSTKKRKKLDFYEKSALPPSILLFFITATFGGIATFLPIFTVQKGVPGIEWYFFLYAISVMISRTFAGKIYDLKGHQAVFIPGASCILIAMIFLAWLPNSFILYTAAIIYGLGFGSIQPALQAWAVQHAAANRKGMANATFYSFFDLGVGTGAILFGQIAHIFNYSSIYIASTISVFIAIVIYIVTLRKNQTQSA